MSNASSVDSVQKASSVDSSAVPATTAVPASPAQPAAPADPLAEKPAVQSTEFWQTTLAIIVPSFVTLLVWMNVVPDSVQKTLANSMLAIINGFVSLIAIIQYIKSRKETKMFIMQQRLGLQINNRTFMLQLYEKGLVKAEALHREFNVPREFTSNGKTML